MKNRKRQYIFTNKKISPVSITSTAFGVIALVALCTAIFLSFKRGGDAPIGYGFTTIGSLMLSVAGLVLAVRSRLEKDMFYIFAYLGMGINVLNLFFIMYILGLGIMEM
ncbi:MAG: DUF6142 family protein [Lachnospiraceae bacterium]|nr:DUF6142 family protein [Lachnospiraceae bacterium]